MSNSCSWIVLPLYAKIFFFQRYFLTLFYVFCDYVLFSLCSDTLVDYEIQYLLFTPLRVDWASDCDGLSDEFHTSGIGQLEASCAVDRTSLKFCC